MVPVEIREGMVDRRKAGSCVWGMVNAVHLRDVSYSEPLLRVRPMASLSRLRPSGNIAKDHGVVSMKGKSVVGLLVFDWTVEDGLVDDGLRVEV